ncbi:hypothetical protein [Planobispora takensis]|uniref:Uncharacterized protein n=1 Tax=Planobispora takensis TaxID=1367882 RepID=A0A8J3TEW6_9ACTN|nr:hypothetical protein [Planobispora takensis]GII06079.1 hypothetical protein Pta02_80870 [Planobispora takensis]
MAPSIVAGTTAERRESMPDGEVDDRWRCERGILWRIADACNLCGRYRDRHGGACVVGRRDGRPSRRLVTQETGRGGSDANTLASLEAIAHLVHGVPDDIAHAAAHTLDGWVCQAR